MSLINYQVPTVAEIKRQAKQCLPLFEVVSLFAGGGGSSTGYRMAGGKVLAINEFVEEARKTYRVNWPDTYIFPDDVRQLTGEAILKQLVLKPGELDILDGSPPCSAFSTAGKRDKNWGKAKKYSDTSQENVEDLFFEYIRILREVKPKVFVAENVAGLSIGTAKGYLNQILSKLKKSGYHVECRQLDARFLGVPQTRTRLIFVGVRNDLLLPSMVGKLHPKPFDYVVPLKAAIDDVKLSDSDKAFTDISKLATYKLLKTLKPGEQHHKRFNLIKAHPNRPSGCITASSGARGTAAVHHWDNRMFSVAEVKRIMSIPDDYILTGNDTKKIERLGRMVPPLMMKAVAENIQKVVLNAHSNQLDF